MLLGVLKQEHKLFVSYYQERYKTHSHLLFVYPQKILQKAKKHFHDINSYFCRTKQEPSVQLTVLFGS